jgi:outer membrane protein assembly factor BamB
MQPTTGLAAWIVALGLLISLAGCDGNPATNTTVDPPGNGERGTASADLPTATPETFSEDENWPCFRGDPKSTGVARTRLPESLDVLWEYRVDNGAFEGTPAIVQCGDRKVVYIGDLDGKLYALDLETGEKIWEFKVEIGFVTGPAVREDRIFLGDIDGFFYCVDKAGGLVWKHQAGAEINSSANFYGTNVLFGSQDTKLYSLDEKSGKLTWEHETADQVRCGVTIVDNRAFVAGCDGGLHTIELDKGTELSSVDIQSPTGCTPAVMGDTVFVGTEAAGFFAIDLKNSVVKWKVDVEGNVPIRSCPAVTSGHVVFGSQDRAVRSIDPESGKQNWLTTLKSKIDSSPVIVGERVFVGSTDGRFYGIDLANGEIKWEKQLNGGIIGSPAAAFRRLVVATDRGVVYCLGDKQVFGKTD